MSRFSNDPLAPKIRRAFHERLAAARRSKCAAIPVTWTLVGTSPLPHPCPECDGDRVVAEGDGAQTYLTACPKCSVAKVYP